MDKTLDSDYYSDDEMVEDDEDDGIITIVHDNLTMDEILEEEDMTLEEIQERDRIYFEDAKRKGLKRYVVGQDDYDLRDNDDDYDDNDDPLCGELDVFEDEY